MGISQQNPYMDYQRRSAMSQGSDATLGFVPIDTRQQYIGHPMEQIAMTAESLDVSRRAMKEQMTSLDVALSNIRATVDPIFVEHVDRAEQNLLDKRDQILNATDFLSMEATVDKAVSDFLKDNAVKASIEQTAQQAEYDTWLDKAQYEEPGMNEEIYSFLKAKNSIQQLEEVSPGKFKPRAFDKGVYPADIPARIDELTRLWNNSVAAVFTEEGLDSRHIGEDNKPWDVMRSITTGTITHAPAYMKQGFDAWATNELLKRGTAESDRINLEVDARMYANPNSLVTAEEVAKAYVEGRGDALNFVETSKVTNFVTQDTGDKLEQSLGGVSATSGLINQVNTFGSTAKEVQASIDTGQEYYDSLLVSTMDMINSDYITNEQELYDVVNEYIKFTTDLDIEYPENLRAVNEILNNEYQAKRNQLDSEMKTGYNTDAQKLINVASALRLARDYVDAGYQYQDQVENMARYDIEYDSSIPENIDMIESMEGGTKIMELYSGESNLLRDVRFNYDPNTGEFNQIDYGSTISVGVPIGRITPIATGDEGKKLHDSYIEYRDLMKSNSKQEKKLKNKKEDYYESLSEYQVATQYSTFPEEYEELQEQYLKILNPAVIDNLKATIMPVYEGKQRGWEAGAAKKNYTIRRYMDGITAPNEPYEVTNIYLGRTPIFNDNGTMQNTYVIRVVPKDDKYKGKERLILIGFDGFVSDAVSAMENSPYIRADRLTNQSIGLGVGINVSEGRPNFTRNQAFANSYKIPGYSNFRVSFGKTSDASDDYYFANDMLLSKNEYLIQLAKAIQANPSGTFK